MRNATLPRILLILLLVVLGTQPTSAAGYLLKQGKGYAICEAFKKRLDKLGSLRQPLAYNSKYLSWEIPGIKEAAWQDLNLETHEELFEKLIRYDMKPGNEKGEMRVKERIAQWRADAKAGKAKLQILRANIEVYDDTPETVARIWRKYGPGKHEYSVTMYPVTEDLTEIDRVKIGRAYWMAGGDLAVYGGRHYVVEWISSGILIASDFGSGLVPFCSIEFDFNAQHREMKK